ncbi:MAG: NAD(P)-dependent oxidoreductase [Nitrospiraceae bacterium]
MVIGGDEEAAEKLQRLLESGAKVTVISPSLIEPLRRLAASAGVASIGAAFRATRRRSAILVLNALRGDREMGQALIAMAREQKFLLWSVDMPEYSNVVMPAVVNCGHLRVAISSTSGQAPALSGFMKEDMERIFDAELRRSSIGSVSCRSRRRRTNRTPRSGARCCARRWTGSVCWARCNIRKSGSISGPA